MAYQSQGILNRMRSFMGEGPEFDAADQYKRSASIGAVSRGLSLAGRTPFMAHVKTFPNFRNIVSLTNLDRIEESSLASADQVGEGPQTDFIRSLAG